MTETEERESKIEERERNGKIDKLCVCVCEREREIERLRER